MKTGFIICALVSLFVSQSINATGLNQSGTPIASTHQEPATITNFEYSVKNDRIYFNWTVSGNQAADKFELQGSSDGTSFSSLALVFGTDMNEQNLYKFSLKNNGRTSSFRLRITQKDGSEQFYPVTGSIK